MLNNNNELIEQIKYLIESAKEDCEEYSSNENSYGCGYDSGKYEAFQEILELLEGEG